jgi:hypothetical protein
MGDIIVPLCDGCRRPMQAVVEVPGLGRQLGAHFFECAECFRSKGVDLAPGYVRGALREARTLVVICLFFRRL